MNAAHEPIRVRIGGRRIAVRASDSDDAAAARAVLKAFDDDVSPEPPDLAITMVRTPTGLWTVGPGDAVTHQSATRDGALLSLEFLLVSDVLARTDRFHLHGAALVDPAGAMVVLILGESGAGKTTLTLSLMGGGFRPLADDVILLDPETLCPDRFPRSFHVDDRTRRLIDPLFAGREWETPGLPPGYCLPLSWAEASRPVGAVVLPAGHGYVEPLLTRLSPADTAMALLSGTTSLDRVPRLALRTAARIAAAAPCFTLRAGTPADNVDLVSQAVRGLLPSRSPA
ncbi:MAG: hypothetical protein AB7N65_13660 [Vicinamibacterales bacterium]